MNGWVAFCLSWQLGQPPQLHVAGGRYHSPVHILGLPLAPVSFDASMMNVRESSSTGPMAAFLAQCRF